jgi:hypothetical protein
MRPEKKEKADEEAQAPKETKEDEAQEQVTLFRAHFYSHSTNYYKRL